MIEQQKEQTFKNLDHKLVYKRIQAVRSLAHISDERVIPSLIKRLSDAGRSGPDYQERVCDAAAEVLEQLDIPEANEIVRNWRTDPFPFFRQVLDWCDDRYEIPALHELGKLDGDRVIDAMMHALSGDSQNVYENARDEIVRRGNTAIPRLIEYLDDDNVFRRGNAALLLGQIGNPIVVPDLIFALHDPKPEVRGSAARALGMIGDEGAVESLQQRLYDKGKSNPYTLLLERVCDIAAKSLQQIGTPKAIQAVEEWYSMGETAELIKALHSDDLYVLKVAVWSAGRLRIKEAIEPLIDLLDNANPEIKRGIIWSLGVLRDPRAIIYLLPYTNDEDPLIANSAREALQKLGHTT